MKKVIIIWKAIEIWLAEEQTSTKIRTYKVRCFQHRHWELKSTISEKMADANFVVMHCGRKSLKTASGCLLKYTLGDLVQSSLSDFHLTMAMHSGKMYIPPSFP